jgi:carboxypeptidase family protein
MSTAARKLSSMLVGLLLLLLNIARPLCPQTTVGTGSIVGIVSDPSGAVISGAAITITNSATGQLIELTTNSSGFFNSGALVPGLYKTMISANKGTIRGDIWLLKTHRSQGAMRERGMCDRFAHAEIVIRVAQNVAQKRASVSR